MEKVLHYLNNVRMEKGLSYARLSGMTGIPKSTLQRYLTGRTTKLPYDMIVAISNSLGVNLSEKEHRIPVIAFIARGRELTENIVGYELVPEYMKDEHYGLYISGNGMAPRMCEGDTVIVHRQSDVASGDVAVLSIGNEKGICKRVLKHKSGISLVSNNPLCPTLFFTDEDIKTMPVEISGKVVELRAKAGF